MHDKEPNKLVNFMNMSMEARSMTRKKTFITRSAKHVHSNSNTKSFKFQIKPNNVHLLNQEYLIFQTF